MVLNKEKVLLLNVEILLLKILIYFWIIVYGIAIIFLYIK